MNKSKSMLIFQELSIDPGNKNIGHLGEAERRQSLTQGSAAGQSSGRPSNAEPDVPAAENH